MRNSIRAYLGLGANLGDARSTIASAIKNIGAIQGTVVAKSSSLYKTSPVGYSDQPDFLNAVIAIDTTASAAELVSGIHEIERKLGRIARPRWHEREIDIDVLTFGEEKVLAGDIVIPHPRMNSRKFVLAPFAEIAPEYIPAGETRSVAELLRDCEDTGSVQPVGALNEFA